MTTRSQRIVDMANKSQSKSENNGFSRLTCCTDNTNAEQMNDGIQERTSSENSNGKRMNSPIQECSINIKNIHGERMMDDSIPDYIDCGQSSNVSSELDEAQINIVNDVAAIIGDDNNMMYSDDEPFGSDCSITDPTYFPSESSAQKETWYEIDESDINEAKNTVYLILDKILDNVWTKVKKLTRKRKVQLENWKKTIAKSRRSDGFSYVTKKKVQPPKIPKPVNCSNCKYKCNDIFSEELRNLICRSYWHMDYMGRKNFILKHVTKEQVKTRIILQKTEKRLRDFSTKRFLFKGPSKIQVCQRFFLGTLCVSKATLVDACVKMNEVGIYNFEDKRGKHTPSNKTSPEAISLVKEHIELFPVMESHYARKDTKKQYLDCKLTIKKMYHLYKKMCETRQVEAVSENVYRNVFCDDYNLSFFRPKKDLCPKCYRYAKADKEKKSSLESEYTEHRKRLDDCMAAKQKDKERASVEKEFLSVTLDLEAVLQIPSGQVSQLYYSRKLLLYNLVIYESALPNNAYCICWSEVNGKKGSCEIGSCIYYYLNECVPEYVRHVTMFSDTCSGQNRNQYVAIMLLWAVQNLKNIEIIEQKFLESGHTYMECDSVHSAIENTSKNCSVYSVNEWKNIFLQSRRKQTKTVNGVKHTVLPYKVEELKYKDMLDLKALAANLIKNRTMDDDNATVNWLKINRLKYVKGDTNKIYFSYNFMADNFKSLTITTANVALEGSPSTRTRTQASTKNKISVSKATKWPNEIPRAYKSTLAISNAKKKNLLTLCKKEIIPEEFHNWFKELKSSADVVERIPDMDINDEIECEEEC